MIGLGFTVYLMENIDDDMCQRVLRTAGSNLKHFP